MRFLVTFDNINAACYYLTVIHSFDCKDTKQLFYREHSRKIPLAIQRTALCLLWQLDAAVELKALRIQPGNRLEAIAGNRRGKHSIKINDQWRICFVWCFGNAYNVEIEENAI
jgi:proteic killer suppression protein